VCETPWQASGAAASADRIVDCGGGQWALVVAGDHKYLTIWQKRSTVSLPWRGEITGGRPGSTGRVVDLGAGMHIRTGRTEPTACNQYPAIGEQCGRMDATGYREGWSRLPGSTGRIVDLGTGQLWVCVTGPTPSDKDGTIGQECGGVLPPSCVERAGDAPAPAGGIVDLDTGKCRTAWGAFLHTAHNEDAAIK
jgi:hypothetical protein